MPLLDVSDIINDPDFLDDFVVVRQTQMVGDDGMAVNTPTRFDAVGVVTSASGLSLQRQDPAGEYIRQSIMIVTQVLLIDGRGTGFSADVIEWNGNHYTVVNVDPYTRYGAGFVQATCDLIEVTG